MARVEVLPIRGANEALSLAEFEFLARLQLPVLVMLDNVPVDAVPPRSQSARVLKRVGKEAKLVPDSNYWGQKPHVSSVTSDE